MPSPTRPSTPLRPLVAGALSALVISCAAATALAGETAYAVSAPDSKLTVQAYKDGFFSSLGHDHNIQAETVTGTIIFDPDQPEGGRVTFEVAARALFVADPGVDPAERAEIEGNMDRAVLETEKHDRITFRSTKVTTASVSGKGSLLLHVTGDLTLHGVTRSIRIPVTLERRAGGLAASGEVKLLQTDFGIEPFSAFLGAVKVRDDVLVGFTIFAPPAAVKGGRS